MKKQLLFCAAFLLALALHAQDEKPVVIISTTGKVGLISEGKSKVRPIEAGAVAKNTSKLKLADGAQAIIYCNGQFKEVNGGQTADLNTLCSTVATRKLDADFEFGEKVMEAVGMVAEAKKRGNGWSNALTDPKKSGDGWGTALTDPKKSGDGWNNALTDPKKSGDGWNNALTDPKKSGDGWGGKGEAIRLIMPFGKLSAAPTTFYWSKPERKGPFQLVIQDVNGKNVHSVSIRDTFVQIDLKDINIQADQIYHWKISVNGSTPIESNEMSFGLGDGQELQMVKAKVDASILVKSSQNPVLRELNEAVALENKEWYYAAQQQYARLAQNNQDNLVRMMHAAFWMRQGFSRLASKAAK